MAKKETKNEFQKLFEKHLKHYECEWHGVTRDKSSPEDKLKSIFRRVANAFVEPRDFVNRQIKFDRIVSGKVEPPIGLLVNLDEVFRLSPENPFTNKITKDVAERVEWKKTEEARQKALKKHLKITYVSLKSIIETSLNSVLNLKVKDNKRKVYSMGREVIEDGVRFLSKVALNGCWSYDKIKSSEDLDIPGMELAILAEGLRHSLYCLEKGNLEEEQNIEADEEPQINFLKECINDFNKLNDELKKVQDYRHAVHFNARLRNSYKKEYESKDKIKGILDVCKKLIELIKGRIKHHKNQTEGATDNAKRKK